MLFAEMEPGWVVVPLILTTLSVFIATVRRDRAKREDESWQQWKIITESLMARALLAESKLNDAMIEKAKDAATIARLEEENRYLRGAKS